MTDTEPEFYEYHPHKPTPLVINEVNDTLVLRESGKLGDRQFVVDAADRPLYDLLMQVLHEADAHCPDAMPAALVDHCRDLVDARETVLDIERGRVHLEGWAQYGMSYCYAVRDAIDAYRTRDPIRLTALGCSGSKHNVEDPVPAKDLYKRSYWTVKRRYGETVPDDWRIISAEHAVLDPETEIGYYERTPEDLRGIPVDSNQRLPDGSPVQTLLDEWALRVYHGLSEWLETAAGGVDPRDVELEILLGRSYRDPLEDRGVFEALRIPGDLTVTFPFQEEEQAKGGNGNQMGWMTDRVDEVQAAESASSPATDDRGETHA